MGLVIGLVIGFLVGYIIFERPALATKYINMIKAWLGIGTPTPPPPEPPTPPTPTE